MKKLIALITVVAVMASMSLTSFAEITVTPDAATAGASLAKAEGETSGYVASYESDEVNTQTTILAVKGETITTSSIQYINQFSDDSETAISFDLRDTLAAGETVTVYIGGDKISKQTIGTIANTEAAVTKYTVTFKVGDVTTEVEYEEGTKIKTPTAPTAPEGQEFKGWKLEGAEDATAVPDLSNVEVTTDVTYVAVFATIPVQPAEYTVIFMVDGEAVSTETYTEGAKITAPAAPEKAGFTFLFWGATADAKVAADLTVPVSGDATFYAIWEENQSGGEDPNPDQPGDEFTLTFLNADGTTFATTTTVSGAVQLPTTDPTKAKTGATGDKLDWAFIGWYTDAELTTKIADALISADTTLYPKFVQIYLVGDVNKDSSINLTDSNAVKYYYKNKTHPMFTEINTAVAHTETSKGDEFVVGDINEDGNVNLTDSNAIKYYYKNKTHPMFKLISQGMTMIKD